MHKKGLHSYNYPEVTNILLGQVPFNLLYQTSELNNKVFKARNAADLVSKSITAFADGPAGDDSDTYVTVPGHKFRDGDNIEISGTTNYDASLITVSDATTDKFSITTNYTPETPGVSSAAVLKGTAKVAYIIADAWCAFKVVSWDYTGQLIGGKIQAKVVDGFPGDDFSSDGVFDHLTIANNISIVAGDLITGMFSEIGLLASTSDDPIAVMAYGIKL